MEAHIVQRNLALARVEANAEASRKHFAEDARAFVVAYLKKHGKTSGEELTLQCKAAGIVPHDDRAFGPVYLWLARRDLIVRAGSLARKRGHGSAGGSIWALGPESW